MKLNQFATLVALCLFALPQILNAQAFELAGQAGSGLLPGNEVPAANSTASGDAVSILFNSGTNELTLDVNGGSVNGFSDLTGNATAMHIHGPAGITSTGGVLYNLGGMAGFDTSANSGGFTGIIPIAAGDVQTLFDGDMYLNIHTVDNPGGELRANIFQSVPEPSSLAILSLVGSIAAFRRRRS